MNKKVLLTSLFAGMIVMVLSCAGEHPGFKKTKTGIYYKMHIENESGRKADTGDILTMDMVYRLKDTTLFDSRMNGQPMMLTLVPRQFPGDIYEALALMRMGDSATFIIRADSFFLKTAGMKELPEFVKPKSDIYFDVKLNNVRSEAEINQEHEDMIAARKEQEPIELAEFLAANNISTTPTASGIYYIEKEKGSGSLPKAGDRLKVHFIIATLTGPQLYSSYEQGQPMELEAGKEFDNPGITEVLGMMRKGSKATAIIPSGLAYGAEGRGEMVAPHTSMKYEIEIVDITPKDVYEKQQQQKDTEMKQMEDQNKLREKANILKYLQDNNLKAAPTASGLYYIEQVKGTGASPQPGQKVKVHYTGKLLNGNKFDSSVDRGQPFEFQLGMGQVIRGWDEGIALMQVGGKALLVIPSELAYGSRAMGDRIPAYSPLAFEVELLGVE